ncbi:BQ2448_5127 [Microbotryum intermedium]|uniref:BQ2448_5127 protein n=1 Tax=Microbotryum intermedium TaxID=269621 RepID=A0A238F8Y3_9BASI|nr:BQ2448_5127 [Microbotryum intermedium]
MGSTTPYTSPPEGFVNPFEDHNMIPEKLYDDESIATSNDRRNRRQRDSWPGVPATSTTSRSIWKKKRCWAILFFVVAGVTVSVALRARANEDARKNAKENHRIGMALCEQYPTLPYCLKIKDEVDPYNGTLRYVYGMVSINDTTAPISNDTTATPSNSTGPSLIHKLIIDAEQQWNAKVTKQSHSLVQAVAEYKRRYNQNPPVGFDRWYQFAMENNVQLIDEYDSIYHNILPYASIPSAILRERADMLQEDGTLWVHNLSFTIDVTNHNATLEGPMNKKNSHLNLTATGHDSGYIVASANMKAKHIDAAKNKRYLIEDELMDFDDDKTLDGWQTLCPVGSPIRNVSHIADRLAKNERKQITFIEDHKEAMNMCNHPEIQPLHRYTSWEGPRPALLFRLFTFATTTMHNDLLLPSLEQWEVPPGDDPTWAEKTNDKVVWRGTASNLNLSDKTNREMSQRPRLIEFGDVDGNVTVQLSLSDTNDTIGPVTAYTVPARELAADYFDFALVSDISSNCLPEDQALCEQFKATHRFTPFMSREEQNLYKYTMDIDGNGWSGRFHTLMSSNSLVLMSTIRPEWYFDRIQPWYHYVPVNVDYSDLFNIMAFFKGDINGNGAHDQLAETIAAQSKEWTAAYWRWEDMQAYLYRLLLEYNRVMQRDPNNYNSHDFTQY